MADIRNARFLKKDYAEKTLPLSLLPIADAATGASDVYDRPKVCWADDNEVVTVGQNEVSHLDFWGAYQWEQTPVASDLSPMELLGASAPISGGTHYTWAWLGTSNFVPATDVYYRVGFVIACQRRSHNAAGTNASGDIIVMTYNLAGKQIGFENLGIGSMPQLQATGVGAALFFAGASNKFYVHKIDNDGTINTTPMATGGYNLYQANQYYTTSDYTWDTATTHDDLRIGFTYNARLFNHALKYRQRLELKGIIGTKRSGTPAIYCSATSQYTGISFGPATLIATDTSATVMHKLLDVETDGVDTGYVLYSRTDTTATNVNCDVFIARVTLSTGAKSTWQAPASTYQGIISNGSLCLHGQNDVTFAVTRTGGSSSDRPENRFGQTLSHVEWATVDASWVSSTVNIRGQVWNHRLSSRLERDKDESPCCLVEQYASLEPVEDATGGAGNPLQPSIVPAAIKPLTTVFIKLEEATGGLPPDGTGIPTMVVATLDAGQSRQLDASYIEGCTSLLDIWYDNDLDPFFGAVDSTSNHEWYLGNRNILGLEDYYAYVSSTVSAAGLSDSRFSLALGDSRMTIWRKAANIDCHASKFPEGFAMNTGVPTWYDGAYCAEMAPLDQPEIMSVSGFPVSAGNVTHVSYNSLGTDDEQVVQAVTGYYDADGVVHRSAPSFPVYVGQADSTSYAATEGWRLDVTVTSPLSIFNGEREYFIEVYAGLAGSVPQLAATNKYKTTNGSQLPQVISFPFILTPGAAAVGKDVLRSSKAVYTAGNVLAADSWPAWSVTARTARRMFGVSVSDPSTVYYSKVFESGVSPEFSASLTVSLGLGRKITAIGTVDDKVLLFEKESITVMYGSGPDNTGSNGDFITESFNTALGCIDQDSIVTIPDGVAFYSSVSGEFHLISRDMQIHDIGSPFEDYTDFEGFTVRDSVNFQAGEEARWYLAPQAATEGEKEYGETPSVATGVKPAPPRTRYTRRLPDEPVAVYNYKYGKWTVLDNQQNQMRVTTFQNQVVGITDEWDCYWTTPAESTVFDTSVWPLMSWETPWIRVNQLQDFGRFQAATFYGRSLNSWTDRQTLGLESSDLQVAIRYDYEEYDLSPETHRFRANQAFSSLNGNRLQFNIKPGRQKCQAVKFVITEIATEKIEVSEPTYTTGRGYELTAVDIHYGAKTGSSKLSAGRKK